MLKMYSPTVDKEKTPPNESASGTAKLLLIDDEEIILEVGREMIKAIGYQVCTAQGGKEALALYQAKQSEIGMVILDMTMPQMSGKETYSELKQMNPDIKVLFSSGYNLDAETDEIISQGSSAFIQKPFKISELAQKLKQVMG